MVQPRRVRNNNNIFIGAWFTDRTLRTRGLKSISCQIRVHVHIIQQRSLSVVVATRRDLTSRPLSPLADASFTMVCFSRIVHLTRAQEQVHAFSLFDYFLGSRPWYNNESVEFFQRRTFLDLVVKIVRAEKNRCLWPRARRPGSARPILL